jgi:serine/threonine protein kinase
MSTSSSSIIFGSKYQVLNELGRGGMGAVYIARDTKLQRQVALKHLILAPETDDAAKEELIYNFTREAIALATINHPNIVNVYDIGHEDDINHYIVMELLDGQPLSKIIKSESLTPDQIINIVTQISDALDYVHNNGVIHRDIKPDNLIYTDKGVCKLTDFGIAKSMNTDSESLYDQGSIVGTILYISPEQLQNPDAVDGRADQFSFAVSLYEILTGKTPFYSENPRDVIMRILGEDPVPPSKIDSSFSEKIDQVLLKALSKNRDDRYATMAEFSSAFTTAFQESASEKIKNDYFAEKRKQHEEFMSNVNLDWLDKLDMLKEEEKVIVHKESFFLQSLEFIVPKIPASDVNNFLLSLNNGKEQNELINFLNNFDGVKTLKEIIQKYSVGNILENITDCAEKNLIDPQAIEMINNLNRVINCSKQLKAIVVLLKNNIYATDIIKLLSTFDGKKTLKEIITKNYSMDQLNFLFNFLYQCEPQEIINFKVLDYPVNEQILFGDMLVGFSLITKAQLNLVLKEGKSADIMIGDNLVSMGFLTKENMMHALKVQSWFRKFFPLKS